MPVQGAGFVADLVGPICESEDYLAKDRHLPEVQQGDLLALMSAGACGYSGASFYNSYALIRERDTLEDMVRGKRLPHFDGM